MTDKAHKVIATALEQFEIEEFDSVAVVMIGKDGEAHFGHSTINRAELIGALRILEAELIDPVMRQMRTQHEETEQEETDEH